MSFRLPTFNLAVNIWHAPAVPPVGAAAVTPMGNLSPGRRTMLPTATPRGVPMELLLPKSTDVRIHDVVECPATTGRYYSVQWVDDAGKGFPNEHRVALMIQAGVWPTPIP